MQQINFLMEYKMRLEKGEEDGGRDDGKKVFFLPSYFSS
jgi:hypothetical protein